ncbi:MAG: hypothetical protein NUW12_04910 [Firmicutes bacterium]|jgi:hypothetical protein|nr:hypothetical protein [Bacillota bacterium]MDH7495687.1 hypothetical protein [Bacillota bacterium]
MSSLDTGRGDRCAKQDLDAHWFGPSGPELPGNRDLITASWERCRALGVDPEGGMSSVVLSPGELARRRGASSRLLKVAEPLMSSLYEVVAGSGHVIVLVDADGYVLSATSDPDMPRTSARTSAERRTNDFLAASARQAAARASWSGPALAEDRL